MPQKVKKSKGLLSILWKTVYLPMNYKLIIVFAALTTKSTTAELVYDCVKQFNRVQCFSLEEATVL